VKWLKNTAAWAEMVRLLLDPPALFHHLHSLDWYRGALVEALPHVPKNLAGKSILEIGCATGDFCGDMFALGGRVFGVDRSHDMVRRAKRAHVSIRFEVADAHSLPYGDHTFDVVFAASLLNVVNDPPRVLREMVRVCCPGGALALLVPAAEFNTAEAKRWVIAQGLTAKETAAYMAWHRLAKKVSAEKLTRWLNEAGLANALVESRCLLGGLVRVLHVYPSRSVQTETIPKTARSPNIPDWAAAGFKDTARWLPKAIRPSLPSC
jgi:ubiquinone/menaquinone biosynthesis C-methylase UbiE